MRYFWVLFRRFLSLTCERIALVRRGKLLFSRRVTILPGAKITSLNKIKFGSDILISHQAFIQAAGGIEFGNNVMIGPGVSIITASHDKLNRMSFSRPVKVCDSVWLGARSIILPGVTVGFGSVVAAGAVVTRDVPECSVVAGVPAKVVGNISNTDEINRYFKSSAWLNQF